MVNGINSQNNKQEKSTMHYGSFMLVMVLVMVYTTNIY